MDKVQKPIIPEDGVYHTPEELHHHPCDNLVSQKGVSYSLTMHIAT
jgi:hypothetical protein